MQNLGIVKPGSTLRLNFDTFDGGTGAPITMTGFTTADIEIYKDDDFVTQRASDVGFGPVAANGVSLVLGAVMPGKVPRSLFVFVNVRVLPLGSAGMLTSLMREMRRMSAYSCEAMMSVRRSRAVE